MSVQRKPRSNVFTLPIRSAQRTAEVIRSEMLTHTDALRVLTLEMAAVMGCGTLRPDSREETALSLKQAAHEAGWSVATLRRHLVRENARSPLDPLGFQPGGLSGSPWRIRTERLHRYLRNAAQG